MLECCKAGLLTHTLVPSIPTSGVRLSIEVIALTFFVK